MGTYEIASDAMQDYINEQRELNPLPLLSDTEIRVALINANEDWHKYARLYWGA